MEPISTMILWAAASLGALPVTVAPKWSSDKEIRVSASAGTMMRDYAQATPHFEPEMRPLTDGASLNEQIFTELLSYKGFADGWDGDDSVSPAASDIDSAIEFVRMLKPVLPLPGAMLDPSGTVGLYWNNDKVYADVNFDNDGTVSLYLRDRMSGEESFYEGQNPKNPGTLLPLMELLMPVQSAA